MHSILLQLPVGFTGIFAVVSTVVFALLLIALVGFAYKSLAGDGITWPEDTEKQDDSDDVASGSRNDEWDYY